MSPVSADPAAVEHVRALILSECESMLVLFGHGPENVPDDFDLRVQGIIDSLGFLELVSALSDELGIELDFEDMEPDDLTTVGPLSRFVAAQVSAAAVEAR